MVMLRVLHVISVAGARESKIQNLLWEKAEESLPANYREGRIETYTQALMDRGFVCIRHPFVQPACNNTVLRTKKIVCSLSSC